MYFPQKKKIDFGVDFSYVQSFRIRPLKTNICLIVFNPCELCFTVTNTHRRGELCTILGMDWLFAMCLT